MPYPLLKNYTESLQVQAVQQLLNTLRLDWEMAPHYFPPEVVRKIGAATYNQLASDDYLLTDDGKYGKLTAARVILYQFAKGLEQDGKVGIGETWPALEKDFAHYRNLAIRAAMTRLPNLSDATQMNSEGTDCGYFAAYAVAKTAKGDAQTLNFSRKDVLAARDIHDFSVTDEWKGKERTTTFGMQRSDAVGYLSSLGATGFSKSSISKSDYATPAAVQALLDARTNFGASPVMVLLPTFLSQSVGHWVGILDRQTVSGQVLYLLFDSSGAQGRSMKEAGWPSGAAVMWVVPSDMKGLFDHGDADTVVAKH